MVWPEPAARAAKGDAMRYKLFGKTGLRVSELALGAMTFGEDWGWGAGKDESKKVFDAYAEAGGNFIDTANHYTGGTSERYVGEFVARDRSGFVVATKYTLNGRPKDPNGGGNQRKNMVQSLEASLKRLNTDYVDVYWVHAWDPLTPAEEVLRGLDDLVRSGKVLYVGISDTPAWAVARSNAIAELRGWTAFAGLQIPYSLMERAPERDLLPMAKALDIAVTTWGALGGGVLTGKYAGGNRGSGHRLSEGAWGDSLLTPKNLAVGDANVAVAKELGVTPSQVALAWVRSRQDKALVIPILGARSLKQLEDNLGALKVELPKPALDRLEEASRIELGFPHDFLRNVGGLIYGETRALIDDHRGR
jgi:aryl-alcohol dehydrogenase-like predicted oxidoreductase